MSLFSALPLRSVTLRNRIAVSPMCQYSCDDGLATDWHLVHLGARAVGGAALVITEATAVEPRGRISPHDLGLWDDKHVAPLARITEFIRSQGAVAGIQLAHAGRKASTRRPWETPAGIVSPADGGWQPVGPSPIAFSPGSATPVELDSNGIGEIRRAFTASAQRALAAGFEVIEIHAAHGYLLHQFLSPLSNQRTDSYGGTFENRIRLVREVVQDVRAVWPDRLPLFVRVSATDWADTTETATGPSWTIEDTVRLAQSLKPLGVDLIDVSSGGTLPKVNVPAGPGYQTAFAARIRHEANIATGAVGVITNGAQADHIVRTGQADLVLVGRAALRDSNFALHAAAELGVTVPWPKQYERARR